MRKQTIALIVVFLVVFLVGTPVLVGTVAWVRMTDPYRGYDGREQFVEIPTGAGTSEIGRRLAAAGVVHDRFVFRAAAWWSGRGTALQAGEYRFDRPMTALAVVDKLARGDVDARRLTFPEGLTIDEMAALFASRGAGTAAAFRAAAANPSLIADLDPKARDLEGYLFPDTYALPRRASAADLIGQMVSRFRAIVDADMRRRAAAQGLTLRQFLSLAALVEKETGKAEERSLVAAVYRNRAKIGMPMQADPTVVYALQKAGRYDGNIRRADLAIDSPYNTYRYPGLPPGPIAAPGRAALLAALEPADVKFLYFVSRNDGTQVYAATLAEHEANVRKFQVEYFRTAKRNEASIGRR